MSDILYPLSLIEHLESTTFAPVLTDEFRAGATTVRRTWTAQYFKRAFKLQHAPLTPNEFQYLRSFYSQRSGMYDYFWFRDNVHLEGNAKVRFAMPLPKVFQGGARVVQCQFDEVAPVRALPEWDEILAAAGAAPAFWWDPCRSLYYSHLGAIISASQIDDFYSPNAAPIPAIFQAQAFTNAFAGAVEQSQYYRANGTVWAKTAANIAGISGTQPALSLFCFARHSANAADQCLFAVGAAGTGTALGLGIKTGTGNYSIYQGNNTSNADMAIANSPVDTWRSFCVTSTLSTNQVKIHVNGGAGSVLIPAAWSYSAGPASIFANASGSSIANPGGTGAKSDLTQCLLFVGTQLAVAQIKALHNLFAPLYGVALV